jgi:hypothetical protein
MLFCDGQHSGSGRAARTAFAMVDDRAAWRRKKREQLAELKSAAIAKLERRGYEVRGKTLGQIRQILERRPLKQKSIPSNQRD